VKNIFLITLTLFCILAFVGCNKNDEQTNSEDKTNSNVSNISVNENSSDTEPSTEIKVEEYIEVNVFSVNGLVEENEIIPQNSRYGYILNKYDLLQLNDTEKDNKFVLVEAEYVNSLSADEKTEFTDHLKDEFSKNKKIYIYGKQEALSREFMFDILDLICPFEIDPVNESDYTDLVALSIETDDMGAITVTDYLHESKSSDTVIDDIGYILSVNEGRSYSVNDEKDIKAEEQLPEYRFIQANDCSTMLTVFSVQITFIEEHPEQALWEAVIAADIQAKGAYKNERVQLGHAPYQFEQSNADGNNIILAEYWPTESSEPDIKIYTKSCMCNDNETYFEFFENKRSNQREMVESGAKWAVMQGDFMATCHGTFAVNSFSSENLWDIKCAGYHINVKE